MTTLVLSEDRTLTLPEDICAQLNLKPGDPFTVTVADGSVTVSSILECYTPERIASFHLNNAVTKEEFDWAIEEVKSMGLDPAAIPFTDLTDRDRLPSDREYDQRRQILEPIARRAS
jgi:antitoxin component of MazEF toxin-antitoxin module